jgi:hypothetical protein
VIKTTGTTWAEGKPVPVLVLVLAAVLVVAAVVAEDEVAELAAFCWN